MLTFLIFNEVRGEYLAKTKFASKGTWTPRKRRASVYGSRETAQERLESLNSAKDCVIVSESELSFFIDKWKVYKTVSSVNNKTHFYWYATYRTQLKQHCIGLQPSKSIFNVDFKMQAAKQKILDYELDNEMGAPIEIRNKEKMYTFGVTLTASERDIFLKKVKEFGGIQSAFIRSRILAEESV